jgi:hypothetical protein
MIFESLVSHLKTARGKTPLFLMPAEDGGLLIGFSVPMRG